MCPTQFLKSWMNEETLNIKGLYAHIPFCEGKCGYCGFYSEIFYPGNADRYLAALEKDIAQKRFAPETIYIGGGTPSVLSTQQLRRLCGFIIRHVSFDYVYEWTFEANPGTLNEKKLAALTRAGVSRVSLGAQSFCDDVLIRMGRRHSVQDTITSVQAVRAAGITNLNLDLIACVPGFSISIWEKTLRQAMALEPDHISVYALTPEEGTQLHKAQTTGEINMLTDEEQLEALHMAETLLSEAGYRRYEISNYAQPGFECRHNLSCWKGEQYVGFGPAAASHVGLERKINLPDTISYIEAVERGDSPPCERETLTPALKNIERLVFGLRMSAGVEIEAGTESQSVLEELQLHGLVDCDRKRWFLTSNGRDLADHVGAELIGSRQ